MIAEILQTAPHFVAGRTERARAGIGPDRGTHRDVHGAFGPDTGRATALGFTVSG
ncbi:hypothetical protein [Streptomyces sp. NPDC047990]|uniref:hypothetical protein n=1 Tax=Streptomyces sp. NPDC047990 TaxID=3365496 RepID=UPI003716E996